MRERFILHINTLVKQSKCALARAAFWLTSWSELIHLIKVTGSLL